MRPAPLVLIAIVALGVLFLTGRAWLGKPKSESKPRAPSAAVVAPTNAAVPPSTVTLARPLPTATDVEATPPALAEEPAPAPSPVEPTDPIAALAALPTPAPQSRDLLNQLTQLQVQPGGTMSADDVARWKQNLQLLAKEGSSGVSAIREFLQKNQDLEFGQGGWDALGYPSLRAALYDTLAVIGGPEALAVSLETLQTAAAPREVALLAKSIETQAPEQHRAEILSAARDSLALAAKGQLEGRDVGPVFEVFENYGGAEVVADLEAAAKQWRYYATAALAQLPDGAGVPALVRMLGASPGSNIPALEALAGLSVRDEGARQALLAQVAGNRIPAKVWPYLAQALTGDQVQVADSVFDRALSRADGRELQTTHINSGNQNFYRLPTVDTLTPDQLNQQVALVEQFIQAAGSDQAAVQALERTRSTLTRRLGQAQAAADAAAAPGAAPGQ